MPHREGQSSEQSRGPGRNPTRFTMAKLRPLISTRVVRESAWLLKVLELLIKMLSGWKRACFPYTCLHDEWMYYRKSPHGQFSASLLEICTVSLLLSLARLRGPSRLSARQVWIYQAQNAAETQLRSYLSSLKWWVQDKGRRKEGRKEAMCRVGVNKQNGIQLVIANCKAYNLRQAFRKVQTDSRNWRRR